MNVRLAESADAVQIAYIFNHYIATSHATFEIDPLDDTEILRRMAESLEHKFPYLVCTDENEILGFAYAKRFRPRRAYEFTAETSVYVKPGNDRRGVGSALYRDLLDRLRSHGVNAVVAGVSLPNSRSVHLHEKFGFEKVAHFREVGRKFDRWIDVGFWELLLRETSGPDR